MEKYIALSISAAICGARHFIAKAPNRGFRWILPPSAMAAAAWNNAGMTGSKQRPHYLKKQEFTQI